MTKTKSDVIKEARALAENPDSAPSITHAYDEELMDGTPKDIRRAWELRGFADDTRSELKRHRAAEGFTTEDQLALWPNEAQRALVSDIERARVYVPSAHSYLALNPKEMTKEQVEEAGAFDIAKGEESIRVGQLLLRLAETM